MSRLQVSLRCPQSDGSSTIGEPLASLAHWLYVQTRGQPSYLVEILKGLLEVAYFESRSAAHARRPGVA